MHPTQRTIQKEASLSGIGIHTGCEVTLTCRPAPPDHGIKFQRIDLPGSPVIEAIADCVVDLVRGTTLGVDDVRIGTVEHVLAALSGLEIDNVLIQLDGPEVPIMDGSAWAFVEILQQVGLAEQSIPRHFLQIDQALVYRDQAKAIELTASPLTDYRLTVMISYDTDVLQNQYAYLAHIEDFAREIAPCRAFVFLEEVENLYRQGLIQGGGVVNKTFLLDREPSPQEWKRIDDLFDQKMVRYQLPNILDKSTLHYSNEPARHKLLDLIGDLVLVGWPIQGQIVAHKPGHAANVAFAKKLRKSMLEKKTLAPFSYDLDREPVFDIHQISNILPHRYPFQLVDKVIQLDERTVTGLKNVTINEPFFQGHFPKTPIMPGVLQLEAMAQTGVILMLHKVPDRQNYDIYLLAIDQCRFRKVVLPGDTLVMRCELLGEMRRGIIKMQGSAFVGNRPVCETIITAQIRRKS